MSTDSERPLVTHHAEADWPEDPGPGNGRPESDETGNGRPHHGQGKAGVDPLAGLHADADCSTILEHINEFLDHELDEPTSDAIRTHLDACEHCFDDYDVVHALKGLVNRCCRSQKAPQQLRMTIVTSITRWRAG